jgi:hypothetical protein
MFNRRLASVLQVCCVLAAALFLHLSVPVASLASAADGETNTDRLFIPARGGGVLHTSDGRVTATVSPGTRASDSVLTYERFDDTEFAPRPGYVYVGSPFVLRMGYPDGFPITTFARPITITYNYGVMDMTGLDESSLTLVYFDATNWIDMPSGLDREARTITAPDSRLWLTALLARPIPPVPTASTISGRVYYDRNGNGVFDGDDFPISTAGVRIASGDWSAFTTSAADGSYSFPGLTEGTYTVSLVVGPEWAFTTPSTVAGVGVTGQPESSRSDVDFGMWFRLP